MLINSKSTKIILLISFMICLFIFYQALFKIEDSKLYYILFSISYFFLFFSVFKKNGSYSYIFLSIMLWLGFWLKLSVHIIYQYDYNEPIGLFIQTSQSLNKVLLIAITGCWGVITARYFLSFLNFKTTLNNGLEQSKTAPNFYQKYRMFIIYSLIILVMVVSILNLKMGIFQVGLVPRTILFWPMNALISFSLGIGFSLVITTILWWETKYEKSGVSFLLLLLIEPFFISISILSRAVYIVRVIPLVFSYLINRNEYKLKIKNSTLLILFILIGLSFIVSFKTVSLLRSYYYSDVPSEIINNFLPNTKNSPDIQVKEDSPSPITIFSGLVIDRWLGIEGVMTLSAHQDKSIELLKKGLLEKSVIGEVGMYQTIANSHYKNMDSKRWSFATMPGPIGFLYYSGSLVVVFLGMFIFTVFMVISESIVCYLTKNVFLCSLYGMDVANTVAQFGVAPSMMIKHFILIFGYCLLLYFIQSNNLRYFKFKSPFKFPQFE